jgi:hypothetical protein
MYRTLTLSLVTALALTACGGNDDSDSDVDSDIFETDTDTGTEDTTPPTVTIATGGSGTATGDVTFTFTFSEDVGNSFAASDVTVTGGTAGAFDASGTSATLVVSPPAGATGTLKVDVAAGAFEDAAGNANTQAATASRAFDTTTPATETVLVDFEGTSYKLIGFGDMDASIVADPTDGTNKVAQLVKPTVAPLWAGTTFSYCPNDATTVLPFDASHNQISMRVWSPDANVPIRMKVETAGDPTRSVETEARTTKASAWETLVFDFAKEANGTAKINYSFTYDKLSVFPNFGTDGATAGAKTYYFDDLVFVDKVFDNECVTVDPGANLLTNPGLEDWPGAGLATGWLVFPGDRTNFAKISTGETMFKTSDTFTAAEGTSAIKLFGIFNGSETETPIYQEFATGPGRTYTMKAKAYMHSADAIEAPDTYLSLQLKFFNADYSAFDMVESEKIITAGSPTNTWTDLTVTGTVPDGFSRVQAAIEFWHCVDKSGGCFTGGGVYVDDVSFVEVK